MSQGHWKRFRRWAGLVSVGMVTFVLGGPTAALADRKACIISGYDTIALPGEKVTLRAKIERHGHLRIRPDVEDERLNFLLNDRLIGSDKTGDEGYATVDFQPPGVGCHRVTLRMDEDSKYKSDDGTLVVAVLPAETPIFITDIDHTIADVSALKFVATANRKIAVVKDSPAVLGRLARKYQIVYITARDDMFISKTREWLDMNKFPTGATFFWDFLGMTLSHRKYKTSIIKRLKQTHPNIVAGAGDLPGDARAYLDNDLRTFIITDDPEDDDWPEDAETVSGWLEIEKALAQ